MTRESIERERPCLCPQLVGNERQRSLLAGQVGSGTVAHAYLLCGPRGLGKSQVALAFARALVCASNSSAVPPGERSGMPCEACRSCRLTASGTHPDVQVVAPEGDYLKISQVREMKRESGYGAVAGERRVWVVMDAETLTEEAQNALLKTLEEPPGACVFVLVCADESLLLPTVVSRCYLVRFTRVPRRQIQHMLADRLGTGETDAAFLSAASDGCPGKAVEWASADAGGGLAAIRGVVLRALRAALHGSLADRLEAAAELEGMKDRIRDVLSATQAIVRDVSVADTGVELMNPDMASDIRSLRELVTPDEAARCLESIQKAGNAIEANANLRLALDSLLVDLKGELACDADRGWGPL